MFKKAIQAELTVLLAAPLHKSEQSVAMFIAEANTALQKAKNEDARRNMEVNTGSPYHEEER